MRRLLVVLGTMLLALVSMASAIGAQGQRASGTLVAGDGGAIGEVRLEQTANGVTVGVTYSAIPEGTRGIHFHEVGRCDGPAFMTAGGHYNPTSRQHGFNNPQGPHGGDLPNLLTNASTATQSAYAYNATTTGITLTPGPASLFDADGSALVIHMSADDNMTDPAGNSGGRIACAVITQAAPGLPNTGAGGLAPPALSWVYAALLGLGVLASVAIVAATRVARRRA